MKKIWRLVEVSIFVFILFQIASLTSFTGKDDPKAAVVREATLASVNAFVQEQNEIESGDAYAIADHLQKPDSPLAELAQREAQRIVESGDVSKFQQELENNKGTMRLLGYGY